MALHHHALGKQNKNNNKKKKKMERRERLYQQKSGEGKEQARGTQELEGCVFFMLDTV